MYIIKTLAWFVFVAAIFRKFRSNYAHVIVDCLSFVWRKKIMGKLSFILSINICDTEIASSNPYVTFIQACKERISISQNDLINRCNAAKIKLFILKVGHLLMIIFYFNDNTFFLLMIILEWFLQISTPYGNALNNLVQMSYGNQEPQGRPYEAYIRSMASLNPNNVEESLNRFIVMRPDLPRERNSSRVHSDQSKDSHDKNRDSSNEPTKVSAEKVC